MHGQVRPVFVRFRNAFSHAMSAIVLLCSATSAAGAVVISRASEHAGDPDGAQAGYGDPVARIRGHSDHQPDRGISVRQDHRAISKVLAGNS